ncbi:MAG: UPF0182 family protein, partial [Gemmatimonadetes bacterium]|nr:UPF0182 family protein [Gemmatimonadota bacterium]
AKWLLSPDPGSGTVTAADLEAAGAQTDTSDEPQDATSTSRRMDPYYLYITLPGEPDPSFLILQPFVPVSENNKQTRLVSFMVAKSDPATYGEMTAFEMPQDRSVLGPVQVDNEINSTAEISRQLTLLDQRGSSVIQGSMQLIPVGDSIVYIRPIYVQGVGNSSFPQFRFVVVFTPGRQAILASNVEDGLNQLFGLAPSPDTPTDETPPDQGEPATGGDVQALLDEAAQKFNDAQDALQSGDLGRYQQLIDEVGDLIEQARGAAAPAPSPPTTTPANAQQT